MLYRTYTVSEVLAGQTKRSLLGASSHLEYSTKNMLCLQELENRKARLSTSQTQGKVCS